MNTRTLKQFLWPSPFLLALLCAGCSYYSNVGRQGQLNINMAKYRSAMQSPPSSIAPAQYQVCDDRLYPCPLLTPLDFQANNPWEAAAPTVVVVGAPPHSSTYFIDTRPPCTK